MHLTIVRQFPGCNQVTRGIWVGHLAVHLVLLARYKVSEGDTQMKPGCRASFVAARKQSKRYNKQQKSSQLQFTAKRATH